MSNLSKKFITTVTNYKNSTWYVKRRVSNNKKVSKLVVQKIGSQRGDYVLTLFSGKGTREVIRYDASKHIRYGYFMKNKYAQEVLRYILKKNPNESNKWDRIYA